MARKVQVILSDDLDEDVPADETVSFSLDGTNYEIDLSEKNAKELRDAFSRYVQAARKVSRGGGSRARKPLRRLPSRLDPASPHRIPEVTGYDLHVIVVCRQGYSSSLAAAGLQAVGLHRATDLAGGVEAWLAAGLPVTGGPADVRL